MAARRYIIMPVDGWRSPRMIDFDDGRPVREIARRSRNEVSIATALSKGAHLAPRDVGQTTYELLASAEQDGPKVVAMTAEDAGRLRASVPSALVELNQPVYAAVRPAARLSRPPAWTSAGDTRRVSVKVVDEAGAPVIGARILAYADGKRAVGASRRTQQTGAVSFMLPSDLARLPRLNVEPPPGYAGLAQVKVATDHDVVLTLKTINPAEHIDGLARWRAQIESDAGRGARVAVIDTGVNNRHPDLAHVILHSVYSYDPAEGPLGDPHPHASHVAGLIGARGPVFRGVAPAAELHSYRITALGERKTDAFHLGEGIARAARENDLHLINVSMVHANTSQFLSKAGTVAFQNGAVCIGAAGNDSRDGIAFPAASKRFIAVTAYGDSSVLAHDALERAELSDVVSSHEAALSRAAFSNWGPEADFIAPGVGLISCRGSAGYAADSGTSFAAPVVTGLAAAMLSKHYPHILAMPKTEKRAAAITQVLLDRGRDLGFAFETQGNGIVDVQAAS